MNQRQERHRQRVLSIRFKVRHLQIISPALRRLRILPRLRVQHDGSILLGRNGRGDDPAPGPALKIVPLKICFFQTWCNLLSDTYRELITIYLKIYLR